MHTQEEKAEFIQLHIYVYTPISLQPQNALSIKYHNHPSKMHAVDTFAYLVQKKRQKYRMREIRLLNSSKAIYYHMKLLTFDFYCPRTLLHNGPTSPTPTSIPLPVRGAIVLLRAASDVLPCGIEATTGASEEALLLLLLEIRIKLVRVEFGSAE